MTHTGLELAAHHTESPVSGATALDSELGPGIASRISITQERKVKTFLVQQAYLGRQRQICFEQGPEAAWADQARTLRALFEERCPANRNLDPKSAMKRQVAIDSIHNARRNFGLRAGVMQQGQVIVTLVADGRGFGIIDDVDFSVCANQGSAATIVLKPVR